MKKALLVLISIITFGLGTSVQAAARITNLSDRTPIVDEWKKAVEKQEIIDDGAVEAILSVVLAFKGIIDMQNGSPLALLELSFATLFGVWAYQASKISLEPAS